MNKSRKYLTDEQVEEEIARLVVNENVKLARLEQRIKNRRRQYLYLLRSLEKRGAELRSNGVDEENIELFLCSATEGEVDYEE